MLGDEIKIDLNSVIDLLNQQKEKLRILCAYEKYYLSCNYKSLVSLVIHLACLLPQSTLPSVLFE